MGRDEVVRISRLVAFGGLTEMDINILLQQGIGQPFFMEALEYYEKKYTINKPQSKPNEIGQRQIIFIN
jgi:hypothetical protein